MEQKKKPVSWQMSNDQHADLQAFCEKHGLSPSLVARMAVSAFYGMSAVEQSRAWQTFAIRERKPISTSVNISRNCMKALEVIASQRECPKAHVLRTVVRWFIQSTQLYNTFFLSCVVPNKRPAREFVEEDGVAA